jgi:hypothetical protein
VPTSLIVEIQRGGSKGNVTRLLEPFATEAEVYAFPSNEVSAEVVERQQHPLWRMETMVEMRAKGMLKKEIAAKFGKSAPWVTYHLSLRGLRPGILQKLKAAPLSVLGYFGLVALMKLAALEGKAQEDAFDESYHEALHTASPVPVV